MKRISSGLDGLDGLIDGGFPQNSCTLVSGGPGTGKTLLGLNFVAGGANTGEKSCYISLNEDVAGITQAGEGTGLKLKNGTIKHMDLTRDVTLMEFMKTIEAYPKLDRLVVDSVNKLLLFSRDEKDYRYQFYRLVNFLRENVGASLLICETNNGMDTGNGEAFECDGVVDMSFLDIEEKPIRILQIHKMRYTGIEAKVSHEFIINEKGLALTEKKVI